MSKPDNSQVVLFRYDESREQRQSSHVLALVQVGFTYIQVQVTDLLWTQPHQRCHQALRKRHLPFQPFSDSTKSYCASPAYLHRCADAQVYEADY